MFRNRPKLGFKKKFKPIKRPGLYVDQDDGRLASEGPVMRLPMWGELDHLIMVWPCTTYMKEEMKPTQIIGANFPTRFIKEEGLVSIFVTLPTVDGFQREFCLAMEGDRKTAADRALQFLAINSTIIKPNVRFFRDGKKKVPLFIKNKIPCPENPRTYIILTKFDTGYVTDEVAQSVLRTFMDSNNQHLYFDKDRFTYLEKRTIMQEARSLDLEVHRLGGKGINNSYVSVSKKKSKQQIYEEAKSCTPNPRYIITKDLLNSSYANTEWISNRPLIPPWRSSTFKHSKITIKQEPFDEPEKSGLLEQSKTFGSFVKTERTIKEEKFNQPQNSDLFDEQPATCGLIGKAERSIQGEQQQRPAGFDCRKTYLEDDLSSCSFDQPERLVHLDQHERSDEFEQPEKSNRFDKTERFVRVDQSTSSNTFDEPERFVSLDRHERSEQFKQPQRFAWVDQDENPIQFEQNRTSDKFKPLQEIIAVDQPEESHCLDQIQRTALTFQPQKSKNHFESLIYFDDHRKSNQFDKVQISDQPERFVHLDRQEEISDQFEKSNQFNQTKGFVRVDLMSTSNAFDEHESFARSSQFKKPRFDRVDQHEKPIQSEQNKISGKFESLQRINRFDRPELSDCLDQIHRSALTFQPQRSNQFDQFERCIYSDDRKKPDQFDYLKISHQTERSVSLDQCQVSDRLNQPPSSNRLDQLEQSNEFEDRHRSDQLKQLDRHNISYQSERSVRYLSKYQQSVQFHQPSTSNRFDQIENSIGFVDHQTSDRFKQKTQTSDQFEEPLNSNSVRLDQCQVSDRLNQHPSSNRLDQLEQSNQFEDRHRSDQLKQLDRHNISYQSERSVRYLNKYQQSDQFHQPSTSDRFKQQTQTSDQFEEPLNSNRLVSGENFFQFDQNKSYNQFNQYHRSSQVEHEKPVEFYANESGRSVYLDHHKTSDRLGDTLSDRFDQLKGPNNHDQHEGTKVNQLDKSRKLERKCSRSSNRENCSRRSQFDKSRPSDQRDSRQSRRYSPYSNHDSSSRRKHDRKYSKHDDDYRNEYHRNSKYSSRHR